MTLLLNDLPSILQDLGNLGRSLGGLQKVLGIKSLDELQKSKQMFSMLESLKVRQSEIRIAAETYFFHWSNDFLLLRCLLLLILRMQQFGAKYLPLIVNSPYATAFVDAQKGVQALDNLTEFVSRNVNGSEALFRNPNSLSISL